VAIVGRKEVDVKEYAWLICDCERSQTEYILQHPLQMDSHPKCSSFTAVKLFNSLAIEPPDESVVLPVKCPKMQYIE
jgi:hypothetical protein